MYFFFRLYVNLYESAVGSTSPPPTPPPPSRQCLHIIRLKCNSTTWWIKLHVSHEGVSKSLLCPARLLHLCLFVCIHSSQSVSHPSLLCFFVCFLPLSKMPKIIRLTPLLFCPILSLSSFDTQCLEWVIFSASAAGGWCGLLQAAEAVPQQYIFVGWLIISETLLVSNN